jgi:tRNA(Arg) A34 adenosine deaminase TadA
MTSPSSVLSPFNLPPWVEQLVQSRKIPVLSLQDRMKLVIRLALSNVEQGTGGPFGAAVFEAHTGALVSVGVNLVTVTNCSHAHAEMVALANAQQQVRSFDLAAPGMPPHELVTSCEPCAMCFGAIPLSGIRSLVCGARSEDAELFGFDEGAKPKHWASALQERGIAVVSDVCRDEAAAVFQEYQRRGGLIYNPRRGG